MCRFVGLSGGQIFHEMMLRLGVKHICESSLAYQLFVKSPFNGRYTELAN
jgi:hypothetical protein